jgi:hypothetical protein
MTTEHLVECELAMGGGTCTCGAEIINLEHNWARCRDELKTLVLENKQLATALHAVVDACDLSPKDYTAVERAALKQARDTLAAWRGRK